ncbi:malto-oligosyltrehalose trehalohydrolase [Cuniculiplasma divulgatum]|uniref:malto-oligosyltrehalose trehalohydrolase n=1 Tax=Cuniculiplasma divulgatum TaxID=1673428 RepID=UPI0011AE6DD1|nr:malto-oligosyltrehalose trehalohydrolase [Cuniculiplasma divulgatum]
MEKDTMFYKKLSYGDIGLWKRGSELIATVWAPLSKKVEIEINSGRLMELQRNEYGIWEGALTPFDDDGEYCIILDKKEKLPDPASKFLAHGVFGYSTIVDSDLKNTMDKGINIDLRNAIIYELHTGTFSKSGNFEGIMEKLDHLEKLGVNVIELMPIAQFEGSRNWGYDGVFPYAIQNTYGSISELNQLIREVHSRNISIILDVVYNHAGPRGNVLNKFGPYFSTKYKSPWGNTMNFDDPWSDYVRNFYIQNAIYWIDFFGFDGLRLDAIHGIYDNSPTHFLKEMRMEIDKYFKNSNKKPLLIAESDANNPLTTSSIGQCGLGMDAQWCDDFHHSIHTYLSGESQGYYSDYGDSGHILNAMENGFVYRGEYSRFLERTRGVKDSVVSPSKLIVFSQNHDQVGNRKNSDRNSSYLGKEKSLLFGAICLLSPYVPMIFMGEEFFSKDHFWFFIDTEDAAFADSVKKGRNDEFSYFTDKVDIPAPNSYEAFMESKLQWGLLENNENLKYMDMYENLIAIRKKFGLGYGVRFETALIGEVLKIQYFFSKNSKMICTFNLSEEPVNIDEIEGEVIGSSSDDISNSSKIEAYGFKIVNC